LSDAGCRPLIVEVEAEHGGVGQCTRVVRKIVVTQQNAVFDERRQHVLKYRLHRVIVSVIT